MKWYPSKRCQTQLPAGDDFCMSNQLEHKINNISRALKFLTSEVLSEKLQRTFPFWGNHQNRTCSASRTSCSRWSMTSSNLRVSCNSFSRYSGSTWILAERMSPVAPRPQSDALKRSGCSIWEHVTTEPSARRSVSSRISVDRTPNVIPDPWVAVAMTPASVCSDIDPKLDMPRPCIWSFSFKSSKVIPPWTTTKHFSTLTWERTSEQRITHHHLITGKTGIHCAGLELTSSIRLSLTVLSM